MRRNNLAEAIDAVVQGSKGGKTPRQAIESPDSLKSIAHARIIDSIGEGEIKGFVHGNASADFLQDVYYNETPVQNADGTRNFKNVTVEARFGTQSQTYIPGFPAVENEIGINVPLIYGTAWTRSFTNLSLSAVRVRLGVSGLTKVDQTTNDIKGHTIQYAIDIATDGGAFVEVTKSSFSGKASSPYERGHRLNLPTATTSGWIIRVRRLTTQASSAYVSDETAVVSCTEIIDGKFRYPNTALIGHEIDASQFQSIPTRTARMFGRIIQVPVNYDPDTGVYTGVWNGTFKMAYSNNPAWVFYDLCTNKRFGLGHLADASLFDKWSLYAIGQYCDEIVPDGFGGTERRMTCNLFSMQQSDAFKALGNLSSVFRGICYWAGGSIVPVADRPTDPVYTYTNANVINGEFKYEGSSRRARHTAVLVSYNDMSNFGKIATDYYDNPAGILRYGFQLTEIHAFACTSRGQAQRLANWLLYTEYLLTNTVSFGVGVDGTYSVPGQIVRIADKHRAGRRIGGRITASTTTTVTLDGWASTPPAIGDSITVSLPTTGLSQTRVINAINPGTKTVTVSVAFTAAPLVMSVWGIDSASLSTQLFRVLAAQENDDGTYGITCLQHNPSLFDAVDLGTPITTPGISVIPSNVQLRPTAVTITSVERAGNIVVMPLLTAKWDAVAGAVKYRVQWQKDYGNWSAVQEVDGLTADYDSPFAGDYFCKVSAVNANGIVSPPRQSSLYVLDDPTTISQSFQDALDAIALAQDTADGSVDTYIQTSAPTGKLGDLWFDSDDNNKMYRHNGTVWVLAPDQRIGQAILDAAGAQATADGKVKTFFAATAPTAEALGDLWYNTTLKTLSRWSGSAWVLLEETPVNANMLKNPTALTNIDYWGYTSGTFVRSVASDGNRFASSPSAVSITRIHAAFDTANASDYIPWSQTHDCTFSADVYVPAGSTGAFYLDLTFYNASDVLTYDSPGNVVPPASYGTWYRVTTTVPSGSIPATSTKVAPRVVCAGATWATQLYFRKAKLEAGLVATAFSMEGQVGLTDAQVIVAIANAATAQSTADGKIDSYYQTTAPSIGGGGASVGDIWFDTDDGNKIYTVVGAAWVATPDSRIALAIADAAGAQATADGKVKTFYQTTAPTATGVGDLWFNKNNMSLSRWSGSAWVASGGASAGTAGTNLIPNPTFLENTVLAPITTQPSPGGLVADNWYVTSTGTVVSSYAQRLSTGAIRLLLGNSLIAAGTTVTAAQIRSYKSFPVEANAKYIINADVFQQYNGSTPPAGVLVKNRIFVQWLDGTGSHISYSIVDRLRAAAAPGPKEFTAPSNASAAFFAVDVIVQNTTGSSWTHNDTIAMYADVSQVYMIRKVDLDNHIDDGTNYGRLSNNDLYPSGGFNRLGLRFGGSGHRIGNQRNLLNVVAQNVRSTTVLSASSAGAVSVNAHSLRYGSFSVSYSAVSNAITGLTQNVTYVIYCIDDDFSGGVRTWLAGINPDAVAQLGDGVVIAGQIKIPTSGSSSGGGGGGGTDPGDWCVAADSYMVDGTLAQNQERGMMLACYNSNAVTPNIRHLPIEKNETATMDCVRLLTRSGASIVASKSTPMTLRNDMCIPITAMLGHEALVYRRDGSFTWDPVVEVQEAGERLVCKIVVHQQCYFAGETQDAFIATHNIIQSKP